jgi:hypothetical protein
MKRIRRICLSIVIVLSVILVLLLARNPLFLKDMVWAILDIGLELILISLLVVSLFWCGLEVNHRTTRQMQPDPESGTPRKSHDSDFWQGISTEMVGAVITTILLGMLVLVLEQYQTVQNRKEELISQMGSPANDFALEAVRQLSVEYWLDDGSLQSANLMGANLQGANLMFANLRGANLLSANLRGANIIYAELPEVEFYEADLRDADLYYSNFWGADFRYANLQDTDLHNAHLRDAIFRETNLQGANLYETNLRGATLENVNLQDVTLPDGTIWTDDSDMTHFTDANHPDFWNPCIEIDPAPWYCEE